MKKILIFNIFGLLLLGSCKKTDNYAAPDMTLEGKVVDLETKENVPTRQPDGIKIRLLQQGFENPQPYDFWAKSDGTFTNNKLFKGQYQVLLMEGAFEQSSSDTLDLDLTHNQIITLSVVPYVRVKNVNISVVGGIVKATYNIERTTSNRSLIRSMLLVDPSLVLHENTIGVSESPVNDLSSMTDAEIASKTFSDEIVGLAPGTYYARVAVLAQNDLNRYNYSPIIEIKL
jgi:hypothetical protein